MKQVERGHDPRAMRRAQRELASALLAMQSESEMLSLLEDLLTPAELEAMADRWRVVPLLRAQIPYREIAEKTGVSVTTVGRVARCLEQGSGGYRLAWSRLGGGS